MTVSPQAFDRLADLLRQRSGLALPREKAYLLESRLGPIARARQLANVNALAALIQIQPDEALIADIVDAMTNNETFFFRDRIPFELLSGAMLPALRKARAATRTIRIWCAAASTGQEPYSIAMILADQAAQWQGWTVEIVATDLSRRALARAEAGGYSQFEVQRGLPIAMLLRHFEKLGECWQLHRRIRDMVQFRQVNLCDPFAHLGQFDIIFCRNVLMYLDGAIKNDILGRIRRQTAGDGYLVLGAAETVLGTSGAFRPDWNNRGLYVAADAP